MAEPTGSLMPAALDSDLSLLADLIDQRNLELKTTIDSDDTEIICTGAVGDIGVPVYITFETGEIVFCPTIRGAGDGWTGVIRGRRGTSGAGHTAGEAMWPAFSGKHTSLLRDCLIAAQKCQGYYKAVEWLGTPLSGSVCVTSDEDKVYFGVNFGEGHEWIWVGREDHDELEDLDEDDHSQYHTDGRAATWHAGITGDHILDGDSHNHSKGHGVGRFAGGLEVAKGVPTLVGQVYYATDTEKLYISPNGSSWQPVTGAPPGVIAFFTETGVTAHGGACPTGWTRFTALDNKFPIGAPTGKTTGLTAVGSDTHSHTYTDYPIHQHAFAGATPSAPDPGPHTHQYAVYSGSGGSGLWPGQTESTMYYFSTEDAGGHQHDINVPQRDTGTSKRTDDDSAGLAEGTTDVKDNRPPFHTVVFCQKD